ncbi:tetratricopeptide repeat protein [Flaviaesturariibacter amylovorans]|uniref:Tetratricopeptide repeat protein n=1 Tax=Flaviaesturariibacter amylovorans TaxID=1084520 RepID=A0ABP8G514_9BACT
MRLFFITLSLLLTTVSLHAQDEGVVAVMRSLADSGQYDKIIADYVPKEQDLPAGGLFFIGHAYFMKEDNERALRYFEAAIAKDAKEARAYFYKGLTYLYMDRYADALPPLREAIAQKPEKSGYHSALGDAHYGLKQHDEALAAYRAAAALSDAGERPFAMIAQIHSDRNEPDKALQAHYVVREKGQRGSPSYHNALFNVGLLELLKGAADRAEPAFLELAASDSTDYRTFAKLVQVYYQRKEYDKARPWKEKLYTAHRAGLLKSPMKDMFCFDQFEWNGQRVMAFERYENGTGKLYYKHIFYLLDAQGEVTLQVQTEYSPVSVEMGGPTYLLGMNRGNTHATFPVGFQSDPAYDKLKTAVIEVFEKKIKPTSASRPGN